MAEWVKAAETQLSMHRFLSSEKGRSYIRNWSYAASAEQPRKNNMYEVLMQAEAQKLLTADAIWVSPEMCEIVQAAREGFQPEPLEMEDFIVHTGFLYFAQPVYMSDRHGMTCSCGAISWCPIEMRSEREGDSTYGMALTIYSSALAEGDDFREQHRQHMREYGVELVPLHLTSVEMGTPFDEGENEDEFGHYTAADEWWKTVQTALRLMQQRISHRTDELAPRPTRRRWLRETGTQPSEVLVIRLRRPASKPHDGEHEPVNWTHRWIVGGFWRNQWYPSLGRHRQVYINDYVKGPDDLPLVVKKRFYKWDR